MTINFDDLLKDAENSLDYRATELMTILGAKLADALKAAREAKGLSQKEVAKELGTSQPRVSQMEDPTYCNYSLASLAKMAVLLDCDLFVDVREKEVVLKVKNDWLSSGINDGLLAANDNVVILRPVVENPDAA